MLVLMRRVGETLVIDSDLKLEVTQLEKDEIEFALSLITDDLAFVSDSNKDQEVIRLSKE